MTTYKINTILLPDRYRDEVILSLAGLCCLLKLAMGRVAFEGNFIHSFANLLQIWPSFEFGIHFLFVPIYSIYCTLPFLYLILYILLYPLYPLYPAIFFGLKTFFFQKLFWKNSIHKSFSSLSYNNMNYFSNPWKLAAILENLLPGNTFPLPTPFTITEATFSL